MRAEHLQEWLREHRAEEAAAEVETKAEVEMLGTEGRERETEEGMADGGEERELNKWGMVVELVKLAFRDRVLVEEAALQAVVLVPKVGGD